ncbi:IPT/TIG domain-containing protein, partial [bacterium]|nr:IPT/TIG domain-containing protein [bacterium]
MNSLDLRADASKAQFGVSVSMPTSSVPVVSSFRPLTGVAGTNVTITGQNLRAVTHVRINDVACSSFTVWGDDRITAEIPLKANTGKITLRADKATGTSAQPFLVISQPQIIEVVPDSSAPGYPVSIRGNGFLGVQEVRFDSVAASRFWVHSDTEIEAFVPFGASRGRIELSGAGGETTSPNFFAVLPPPNALIFGPKEDSYVVSNGTTATHGGASVLQIKKTSSQEHRALLKFRVIGLWARPDTVKFRLHVTNSGDHGGTLYVASNDYSNSSTPWIENAVNWGNAPRLIGTAIDSVGETRDYEIVELDVTDIVTEDGFYSFALVGRSSDVVRYSSQEGEVVPQLVCKFASDKPNQGSLNSHTGDT